MIVHTLTRTAVRYRRAADTVALLAFAAVGFLYMASAVGIQPPLHLGVLLTTLSMGIGMFAFGIVVTALWLGPGQFDPSTDSALRRITSGAARVYLTGFLMMWFVASLAVVIAAVAFAVDLARTF